MKKIKGSYLVIGVVAVLAVIVVIGLKKGWFNRILHRSDKPRTTAIEDIPVPLITESVRKSVYNGF